MVIALCAWNAICSKIKRVLTKSHAARPRSGSAICNHKSGFRTKLHDAKCNFYFITLILKSTSGNTSLFTKNTPELVVFCNISTCEQKAFTLPTEKTMNTRWSFRRRKKGKTGLICSSGDLKKLLTIVP